MLKKIKKIEKNSALEYKVEKMERNMKDLLNKIQVSIKLNIRF